MVVRLGSSEVGSWEHRRSRWWDEARSKREAPVGGVASQDAGSIGITFDDIRPSDRARNTALGLAAAGCFT